MKNVTERSDDRSLWPDRSELVDLAVIGALTIIAIVSFRSSYGGVAFLVVGVIGTLIGLAIAWQWSRRGWAWPFGVLAAVAAYAVIIGAVALPDRAIAGVLPSPGSVTAALRTAITGWKELITTQPPVGRTGDLMVLPGLCGVVSGFCGYLLSRRIRRLPLALALPFTVLGLGIATGVEEPVSVVLHGSVMVAISLAWLAHREHRARPLLDSDSGSQRRMLAAGVALAVAATGGWLIADSLPGSAANDREIWRGVVPPFDPQEYPSPLAGYRAYVKAADCRVDDAEDCDQTPLEERDPVMFAVEGLPVDVPVRLATMDHFDGLVWQTWNGGPDAQPSINRSGAFERVGVSIDPEFPGEIADVAITIGEYEDVWIPTVGEVIRLEFSGSEGGPERDRQLAAAFRYNQTTDTAASPLRLTEGDRYTMRVRLPVVLEEYAGELVDPTRPVAVAQPVDEIGAKLSSAELLLLGDDGERLDFVQDLMVRFGTYSDGDIAASQIRSEPGHSTYRMNTFVQQYPKRPLIGNAEQYASAYALMFRNLGLPTRVVMGFMPSDSSLDGSVGVRATEVEAWVELPFTEHGWVGVFPTPPRDQTSIQTSQPQQPEPDYRTQNPPPPPLIDPEFDASATRSGQAAATEDEDQTPSIIDESGDSGGNSIVGAVTAPVFLISLAASSPLLVSLAVAAVILFLKRRRRQRRESEGAAHERIANGWRELTDYATDTGRVVPPTTTRREAAALVGADTRPLADRADAAVWGAGEPDDAVVEEYWDDLRGRLEGMRSELSLVDRWKAALSLQSLRRNRIQSTIDAGAAE